MKSEEFCEVLGDINETYVKEAGMNRKARRPGWVRWGAIAACLCVMITGGILLAQNSRRAVPNPDSVQIPNPMITVTSLAEMEEYLDFKIPVLDKEAAAYTVFVEDSRPTMGQISYADGSEFRMQYGSGDISGIYGGTLEESREIDGVEVSYYRSADAAYAIWEQDGFTFSYQYTDDGSADVEVIIQAFQ